MGYFKQKVTLYKKIGNRFSSGEDFTDFYNFQINKGVGNNNDTFQFNIINSNNRYNQGDIKFKIGDRVVVYMWKNTANPTTNDIIIDAFITKLTQTISGNGKIIQVFGKNALSFLFNTPVFLDTLNDGSLTPPYIIQKIIKDVNEKNKDGNTGFTIRYSGPSSTGSISTLKSDGSVITNTISNIQDYWKRASDLINDYSQPENTGDSVPHMAYFDIDSGGNLYFYWQPRTNVLTSTSVSEGSEPTQIKTGYKSEVVNAVIANCGVDPNNHGISVFVPDYQSINTHGAKWKYVGDYRNTAEDLMQKEINRNPSDFDSDSGWFPKSGSFPYTTAWGTSCADKSEYKKAVRDKSKLEVKKKVKDILRGTFDPKFVVDVEVPGIPSYKLGNYIPHTINSYNITSENLRLIDLSHSFWNSEMSSEEDSPGETGVS